MVDHKRKVEPLSVDPDSSAFKGDIGKTSERGPGVLYEGILEQVDTIFN